MTTGIKAPVAPVGGLRQLLELPEGAPRICEDFTYMAAESAGDPRSAATQWFSINLTVCCVNRSLGYLDIHFTGIVDLFDLAVGGRTENYRH